MIRVSRFNNTEFMINCELIEIIEETPDTVITLTTGKKFVVKESMEEIVNRIIEYKGSINYLKITK
ncbi:flagellar FlbD family protein [Proteiniborus sp. MB09-C3]|uniref:flagellar FlbD family protein n=1 Tax=Proteiniborus sp. MB09-C3 TaxID=3050072 RepID=UPI00255511B7|nr:flagellar FlbD family protein [Proteiniborus sp. MB09-C3]WIV10864.1 flagellar FlbD family protein [Proteiniborus sp. MB09-C3]